ncbi:hypothetical protein ENUP19_0055G0111 [Entamoeba nuttalli]|uniref:Uncharacterized protein n=2 Tax=Entamoeba nuttalli TaxID=412467 RepID=K2GT79_ENTNP|nr:hypothetical protein ENU1_211150 [Entamoeba nuttalli P19]EKE37052.1 hypothetical protein ENU1_211150 [Entamoeba nuttalli P19]|eukprot:XP_008860618.1 hypothetical protein ENU1_211150 [Entamoeba nuttalli P19]
MNNERNRIHKKKETNLKTFTEIVLIVLLAQKGWSFYIKKPHKKTEDTCQFLLIYNGFKESRSLFFQNNQTISRESKSIITKTLLDCLLKEIQYSNCRYHLELNINTTKKYGKNYFPKIDHIFIIDSRRRIDSKKFQVLCEELHLLIQEELNKRTNCTKFDHILFEELIEKLKNENIKEIWKELIHSMNY